MNIPSLEEAHRNWDAFAELNRGLEARSAEARVAWALEALPAVQVLSTSFGAQAAVTLHLVTRQSPDIPVIFIDTGYHFPETYQFADTLGSRFRLNLKVCRGTLSAAWQEARYGRLWEQGTSGIERYNRINKVEPMRQALQELRAATWITGLRRLQSHSRKRIGVLMRREALWKLCPLADWSDRDVWCYLKANDLPYHPLWKKGYVSIGDVHTTRRWEPGMRDEDTRFFGLRRECGLHVEI